MHGESLIIFLVVGIIAGWLAGVIMNGGGFGLIGDLIVGVVGAFIAGLILPSFHVDLGSPHRQFDRVRADRGHHPSLRPAPRQARLRAGMNGG